MTALDAAALRFHLDQLPPLVDDPAYLVFADWLQSQGHPWGELVILHHRTSIAPTEAERAELERAAELLLAERGAEILGELPRDGADLVWHLGFVRRARLKTPADGGAVLAAARALLAAPAARMIETLVLAPLPDRFDTTRDWDSSPDNIVDPWPDWDDLGPLVHERLAHLGFGGWPATAASAYVRMPSFDAVSRWLRTTLRKLELTGSARDARDRLDLPELVELDLRYADASSADLDVIAASKLPALERLSISLGGSSHCILDDVYAPAEYDEDDEDQERYPDHYSAADLESMEVHGVSTDVRGEALRRLLDALPPRLSDFGLPSSVLNAELLGTLVRHPRIATLRRLDLSACTISDQTVPILIEARDALARIGAIDLSRNQLTSRFTSRLAAALPNATIGEQGRSEPDFFMRYVATME
ncbi:MAG TPA: hypothetical protein VN253_07430 [Kofleriaceae bacterium]|nr:hypothetical protein [Kofleriaceae bacterium]